MDSRVWKEQRRLALDGLLAQLDGDDEARYRIVGELWDSSVNAGAGSDLQALVETIMCVAASLGDSMDRTTAQILSHVTVPGGTDESGHRMQVSALFAATVMADDPDRGRLLALENAGWKQARVEALHVAAHVLTMRPDLRPHVISDLREEIESRD
jgi:hypothetical protein